MMLLAIRFTETTYPKIVKAYPFVAKRWDNEDIYRQHMTPDNFFVIDTEYPQFWRILTLEHFEDVYETDASEIEEEFTEI